MSSPSNRQGSSTSIWIRRTVRSWPRCPVLAYEQGLSWFRVGFFFLFLFVMRLSTDHYCSVIGLCNLNCATILFVNNSANFVITYVVPMGSVGYWLYI